MQVRCLLIWGLFVTPLPARAQAAPTPEREIFKGIATDRPTPGAPYELAGKRIVFTNWYTIQPGDLDWRDAEGKSVYVTGKSGPLEAHHVGINASRGIRIMAEKQAVTLKVEMKQAKIFGMEME